MRDKITRQIEVGKMNAVSSVPTAIGIRQKSVSSPTCGVTTPLCTCAAVKKKPKKNHTAAIKVKGDCQ